MGRLRDIDIRNAKPSKDRARMLGDGSGLWLKVYPTGRKSWMLRRAVNGRLRFVTLGTYPDKTLKDARDLAHDKRKESSSVATPRSVKELADAFYEAEIEPHYRRPEQIKRYLDKDLATIAGKRVADVERADLSDILRHKRQDGRVAANRLLAIVRRMFRHAHKLGWIDNDPAALLDRSVAGGRERPRERVLTDDEIRKLWAATEDGSRAPKGLPHHHGALLRFLLLEGQRIAETQAARWEHIDFKKGVWDIPAEHTKSGRQHWVSLPKTAVDLLRSLPRESDTVFPDYSATGVQSWLKRWCTREEVEPPFTPHDLRRTLATRMNTIGIAPHVVEKILNHSMQGVMAVYNRAEYQHERIEAQELWAKSLSALIGNTPRGRKKK